MELISKLPRRKILRGFCRLGNLEWSNEVISDNRIRYANRGIAHLTGSFFSIILMAKGWWNYGKEFGDYETGTDIGVVGKEPSDNT